MSTTHLPAGPEGLGIVLGADATPSEDGWLVRELVVPPGLDGPPGILQGGLAAGLAIPVAQAVDPHGAPVTGVDARLHAPTPLGRRLAARVRGAEAAARYEVEVRDDDRLLVSAEVELAGRDPASQAYDLLELAQVPLPRSRPQHVYPTCVVCGPEPTHPHGQRLHPAWHAPDQVVVPWVCDDALGDERGAVDVLMVSAVLDCPTVWASMEAIDAAGYEVALLAGYHLRFFHDAPVMAPLRTVARFDGLDGRKVSARGALVDEDGVVYALSSALHVAANDAPPVTAG